MITPINGVIALPIAQTSECTSVENRPPAPRSLAGGEIQFEEVLRPQGIFASLSQGGSTGAAMQLVRLSFPQFFPKKD